MMADTSGVVTQGASYPQDSAGSTCVLTDVPDCTIKAGEQIRTLSTGTAVEGEISSEEKHYYRLTLPSGQFLQAVINQRGVDLTASICTQDGHPVAEVDRQSGSRGPETISIKTQVGGDYILRVQPIEGVGVGGRYEIKIKELRELRPADDIQIDAERIVTEGGKYFVKGKPDCLLESIKKYEQALKFWQSLGNDYEVAVTLYGLGWSYSNFGAYGMVKFPFSRSQLRWSYETREEHLTALKYFNQSLDMMRTMNITHGQAIALVGVAYPELYLGRSQEALGSFSQALRLFESMGNKSGQARAAYGRGWAYALLNEDQKALDSFLQALQFRQASKDQLGEANTLAAICRMYSRLGKNQEALDYGQRALKLYKDSHGQASTHTVLGWIYIALGQHQDALRSFEEAIKLRGHKDPTGKANALYGIARVQSEMGNLPDAIVKMKEVVDTIEELRKKGSSSELRTYYFANVQEYYEYYIDLLMRAHQLRPRDGHDAVALGVNERARARELLTVLAKSDGTMQHEFDAKLGEPVDAVGIRELLDEGTLLLEYSLGAEKSYLWLVSSKEVLSYELPKRAEIEEKALLLYQLLTERNRHLPKAPDPESKGEMRRIDAQAQMVAEKLSGMLLSRVAGHLEGKRLVVVTQGALQLVPFGALPAPTAIPSAAEIFKPLISDHEVISLPSASILRMLRHRAKRAAAPKTIAVLADPVFTKEDPRINRALGRAGVGTRARYADDLLLSNAARADGLREKSAEEPPGDDFRRLPGTRWEAQQIVSLVPKEEALLALDFAASRDTAMSEALTQYQIIHFATHAFVDDNNPALSKIVFSQFDAQGRPRNGNLTLADVYKMRLHADLVVLSACRTALGADTKGEGLIGLTGGFMHSGVPRVLVSMWPISDSVAAEMMARLYRKMLGRQKLSPAAALRRVQLEMWKDERWNSPYFWSAFIYHGEWRWP
jgi:CHAT domain-containing protein/tetratricopeptide (TPR) repeat protein